MAIRITKQQVEDAAAARETALAEDPDFRRVEEELANEEQKANQEEKNDDQEVE